MNDKDKEEYDKWLEAQNWHYDSFDNEYYQNGLKVSIYGETEEAWQAACKYKNKEYSDIADARMQTSLNNVKLEAENQVLSVQVVLLENKVRQYQSAILELQERTLMLGKSENK